MPLPSLKPLLQAATQAYQAIGGVESLAELAEIKMDGSTAEEQNKQLLDKLAAIKELEDGSSVKALHTILTHCGKLVTPTADRSASQLFFELQELDHTLATEFELFHTELTSHRHPFFDAYTTFKYAMKKHVGELEAQEARANELAPLKALQAALDEAKKDNERIRAEHQAQLQALEKAHQAALDEARRENARLIAEHQVQKQHPSNPREAKEQNTDKGFAGTGHGFCDQDRPASPVNRAARAELQPNNGAASSKPLAMGQAAP